MNTEPSEREEAPECIWTVGGIAGHFFTKQGSFAQVEYIRADLAAPSPTTPSDAAMRAAEEISSTFGLKFQTDSLHRAAAIITCHLAGTPAARFVEVFCDTAIKCHIGFKHEGPWEKCEWIECEDRRKIIGATASPEIDVEPRICFKCGHEERHSDNEGGTCEKIVDEESNFCGCVCRFAAPVTGTGDDEGEK